MSVGSLPGVSSSVSVSPPRSTLSVALAFGSRLATSVRSCAASVTAVSPRAAIRSPGLHAGRGGGAVGIDIADDDADAGASRSGRMPRNGCS